jgi:hypothetical protein
VPTRNQPGCGLVGGYAAEGAAQAVGPLRRSATGLRPWGGVVRALRLWRQERHIRLLGVCSLIGLCGQMSAVLGRTALQPIESANALVQPHVLGTYTEYQLGGTHLQRRSQLPLTALCPGSGSPSRTAKKQCTDTAHDVCFVTRVDR